MVHQLSAIEIEQLPSRAISTTLNIVLYYALEQKKKTEASLAYYCLRHTWNL